MMNISKKITVHNFFNIALKYIINILIIYIIVVLIIGLANTLYSIRTIFFEGQMESYLSRVVPDILTFLVLIELFRSFVEYFRAKRLRLHTMLDPAIVFIVRELIVKLYTLETCGNIPLVGFAVLLFCLGIIRTLAILYSPDDQRTP
jgi:uncharacterized membrane protein (DUF373 family)